MARDRSPIVKQSRREGFALHIKAHKVMAKKVGMPGVHPQGGRRNKPSTYSLQLREKQKVRRLYGLLEKQFARTMKEASRSRGQSGQVLLELLERRLDNVVYRAGWATSRRAARQLVNHGHFILNGGRVDIPSLRVKTGDVITIREANAKNLYFAKLSDIVKDTNMPQLSWLKSDPSKKTITVTGQPQRTEADLEIKEQLIVEYYSR